MSQKRHYGLLVKWLNTLPSQGNIHGFEFHTGHQLIISPYFIGTLFFSCIIASNIV